MSFKTPSFWYDRKQGFKPLLLSPASLLYGWGDTLHEKIRKPIKADIPVICVGNLNAGGSGKTPVAISLIKTVLEQKLAHKPFFLSRGYGGELSGPVLVNPDKHSYQETGDETLLLSKHGPVVVSVDRAEGAHMAQKQGGDLVIMDDGFQNYDLVQDIRILVINGEMGFGNGKIMPAGPLREKLSKGLVKADAFVIVGKDEREIVSQLPDGKPIFYSKMRPKIPDSALSSPLFAFSGLGWNDKFYHSLEQLELNIVETASFGDHHPYSVHDIETLRARASDKGASLITTAKDMIRVPQEHRARILCADIDIIFEDQDGFAEFIRGKLAQ